MVRPFASPGTTTTESAERIGYRPVMNDARPAVQLAWPYQLVKTAPSLATRSTLGVGWPKFSPPPYAPKSFQPVSSVIKMTTFGFEEDGATCAAAHTAQVAVKVQTAKTRSMHPRVGLRKIMDLQCLDSSWTPGIASPVACQAVMSDDLKWATAEKIISRAAGSLLDSEHAFRWT